MNWDNLSMKEKAAFIDTAVKNNIYDLQSIIDKVNTLYDNENNKKADGGEITTPIKPFSYSKPLPSVRYNNGGYLDIISIYNNIKNRFDDGGKVSYEDLEKIAFNSIVEDPRNPLDIKYDFINDIWDNEYTISRGYDKEEDKYYPYDSPEGGLPTIGPGLKILPDDKPNNLSFTLEEVKKGVTKAQIQEKLHNQAKEQYNKVIEYLNQKGPVYTNMINSNIIQGLMDLRYQVGALGDWKRLRDAVLNNDIDRIIKESKVTFKDEEGVIREDKRRNKLRREKYWEKARKEKNK